MISILTDCRLALSPVILNVTNGCAGENIAKKHAAGGARIQVQHAEKKYRLVENLRDKSRMGGYVLKKTDGVRS